MNNIEITISVIILLIIFLISINSSSNILLYINNNNVRFLMILSIIIIGHYDVNMAGLSGLLFLLLVNKANYIEGFSDQSNSDKYANLRMWLYLMLINPTSFDSKEKNVIRNEIDKLKFEPSCQDFVNQYRKLMDDNLAGNIAIIIVNIDSEVSEINMIESYKKKEYNLKQMIRDLEMFLNEKKIVEKEYLKNKRIVQMMKEKGINDNLSFIMDSFIPFLSMRKNEDCLLSFLDTVTNNLKTKYDKVDELKKKKMINNFAQNAVEKTPQQKIDEAKSADVKASSARKFADEKIAESNDAEYNAKKLKMYAEAKWVEAKASEAKKLADTKAAEAKAAEAKANEAKANEDKSNQAKGSAEAESAKANLVAKTLVDEALRLKILALEAEEDAKVKANAYAEYYKQTKENYSDPKEAEKNRLAEAERQQKAEQERIEAERQKAERERVEAERQKAERERVEAERQKAEEVERQRRILARMGWNKI